MDRFRNAGLNWLRDNHEHVNRVALTAAAVGAVVALSTQSILVGVATLIAVVLLAGLFWNLVRRVG